MIRVGILVACVAGILALAGCGGGGGSTDGAPLSKEEYQQQVTELGSDLEQKFGDIDEADANDLSEVPALMNRLGDALDATADGFAELTPPDEIAAEHDRFVAAARATAEDAREIGSRIEEVPVTELTPDEIAKLDISKAESFLELQAAMAAITAKGYEFGDNFGG